MDPVTVLVTGAGAPGIAGTLYCLRNGWEQRALRVVCVDAKPDVVGRYLGDAFHVVPSANDARFIDALHAVCVRERVTVILPQVTAELPLLAAAKPAFERDGVRIAISDLASIEAANDKHVLAERARALSVCVPEQRLVTTWDALEQAAHELGFPAQPIAVKQPRGNGMRGYRAIFAELDRKRAFYEQKPDSARATLSELRATLGDDFPALMVMEYLPGLEHSVDVLADGERVHAVVPRERTEIRTGITFGGRSVEHAGIIADASKLARGLGLTHAFGFQFKADASGVPKLLECNPRVQGTMVMAAMADANVIYGAIKLALGEPLPELKPRWGTSFLRFWGGVGINDTGVRRM